jgi:hypothetical protein
MPVGKSADYLRGPDMKVGPYATLWSGCPDDFAPAVTGKGEYNHKTIDPQGVFQGNSQ